MILKEHKRVDGRALDEIRPLSCEVGVLPRVHGSAIFTRGQTQAMSIATLGMVSEEQMLDGLDNEETKRYMHQYNFPGYSVGEAKASRGPGRREIGHGALAEKALVPVLPSVEEFPYAIRVVSEILSSNGSTSQASICGSTLALMDAGVPIKRPVAGISTGLVSNPDNIDDYVMLTDIQGIEDFFGDMDFKVGGTHKGITAIQVDIKIDGLTYEIIEEAFERTKVARDYILDEIMFYSICSDEDREKIKILFDTYFKKGGCQLMVTVVDHGVLEDAQKHPEKYPDLIVRVAGYSAVFVNLTKDIQEELLSRTLYD